MNDTHCLSNVFFSSLEVRSHFSLEAFKIFYFVFSFQKLIIAISMDFFGLTQFWFLSAC